MSHPLAPIPLPSSFLSCLTKQVVSAAYVDSDTASAWLAANTGHQIVHAAPGWSKGMAFACHPEYGDFVAALNNALVTFKGSAEFTALCGKYPSITCASAGHTFSNVKTAANPEIADHPSRRADIVIGCEADWGDHNWVRHGVAGGFDYELTYKACEHANKACAIVGVPWQAVWPSDYARFGWPVNEKLYPGEGHLRRWFHCSTGTMNIIARQQSTAFSNPMIDPAQATAGFVVADANAASVRTNAAGKVVGVVSGYAASLFFMATFDMNALAAAVVYENADSTFAALEAGSVDVVYTDSVTARAYIAKLTGYQLVHETPGWSYGASFSCTPEYGEMVTWLNQGFDAFKNTPEWIALCNKYPTMKCDMNLFQYRNIKVRGLGGWFPRPPPECFFGPPSPLWTPSPPPSLSFLRKMTPSKCEHVHTLGSINRHTHPHTHTNTHTSQVGKSLIY